MESRTRGPNASLVVLGALGFQVSPWPRLLWVARASTLILIFSQLRKKKEKKEKNVEKREKVEEVEKVENKRKSRKERKSR